MLQWIGMDLSVKRITRDWKVDCLYCGMQSKVLEKTRKRRKEIEWKKYKFAPNEENLKQKMDADDVTFQIFDYILKNLTIDTQ